MVKEGFKAGLPVFDGANPLGDPSALSAWQSKFNRSGNSGWLTVENNPSPVPRALVNARRGGHPPGEGKHHQGAWRAPPDLFSFSRGEKVAEGRGRMRGPFRPL